jgi:hypothetical protein
MRRVAAAAIAFIRVACGAVRARSRHLEVSRAHIAIAVVVLVLAAAAAASGGYGRLLAQSKPLASDPTVGYLAFTRLPANLHVFTLVFTGPHGQMAAHGFIQCINPGIRVNSYPITTRPYVRSYRTPPGSTDCRAGGDTDVLVTNPDGTSRVVPGTVRLYGR